MSVLDVTDLSSGYGPQPVIRDINLHVNSGEVVALLGANGAGKTTALMAMSGVLPILGGEVRFDGKAMTDPLYMRARNGLSFVTEERSVFKTMSVADNLRVAGVETSAAIALFPELEKRLEVNAGLISGGEQQMLSLARAIAREPKLLFADELSLGLAPIVVTRLFIALRDAAQNTGAGVLLVEQHVRKALLYVDRVYVMRRGQIHMSLTVEEARERVEEIEEAYLASEIASVEEKSG
jgi:branched-chain amino acid transport system ATP-binding protein